MSSWWLPPLSTAKSIGTNHEAHEDHEGALGFAFVNFVTLWLILLRALRDLRGYRLCGVRGSPPWRAQIERRHVRSISHPEIAIGDGGMVPRLSAQHAAGVQPGEHGDRHHKFRA